MAFDMEIFAQLRELADLEFFLIFAYALCLSCRGPFRRLPTRFACLVVNFSDACLRTAFVLRFD